MPNICSGEIMVRGSSKNVEEFIKVIQADYNYNTMQFTGPRHMFRVFEASVCQDYKPDAQREVIIIFDCAWSVYSCMLEGPFSYYNDYINRENSRATSLLREADKLCLSIEVLSEESGMGFCEHYIIHNGKMYLDKTHDLYTYCLEDYDSLDDFNKQTGLNISEKDLDDSDFYSYTDMKWEFTIDHDNLNDMLLKPMIKKIQ